MCEIAKPMFMSYDSDGKTQHASGCHTFLSQLLPDEQNEKHIQISQDLLDQSNKDDRFLKCVIIGDEIWVYGYDVPTAIAMGG